VIVMVMDGGAEAASRAVSEDTPGTAAGAASRAVSEDTPGTAAGAASRAAPEEPPEAAAEQAAELVAAAARVTALTGAGISTDSGIPDFRGPQGVWTRNPEAERTATLSAYLADPEVRRRSWRNRLESPAWTAEPNAGHRALVELERQGRLVAVVTQNIDGLHQKAGNDPRLVVEVHGTMHRVRCWACGWEAPMGPTLERVRAGEADPACEVCGGILKSATISFGQSLDPRTVRRAEAAALSCDLFLAVGTSLAVYPAAGLLPLAQQAGAAVVIVNGEPTPYDDLADAVVRGSISEVLPLLVATRHGGRPPRRGGGL
jgi:NAD-dependent deacetylase